MNTSNTVIKERNERDVAIIGIGLRLPGNSNRPNELWDNLLDGFDGIVETTDRWSDTFVDNGEVSSKYAGLLELDEWMSFDALSFGINPTDAKQICPQQKVLLKSTWEALEDAGIDPLSLRSTNTSVFIGASSTDYASTNFDQHETPANCFNSNLSGVANRISYSMGFQGTSVTIDTVCSSSLNAVHFGYRSIVNNESKYSVVGGCNFILSPTTSRSFEAINITGKSGRCKPFDESADGFVRAEGVVVLILKKLSTAIMDGDKIYSIIKGSSSNSDGTLNKTNFFAPSKTAQTNNIKKAFESTNGSLNYSDIDFFELHGTGTPVGDPIEVEAVTNVFKDVKSTENPLLIGSIKSNIGHLEPCSGVASLAKCCLMMKHRKFVKNIHFNKPNPNIKFEDWNVKVCTETTPFPDNKIVSMAINSFGITGSNVCLLLSEYVKPLTDSTATPPTFETTSSSKTKYLIPVSANSKKSLDEYKSKLIDEIDIYSKSIKFQDFIKYHILSKSIKLEQRSIIIANDWLDINVNSVENESIISTVNINKSGNIIKDNNKQPTLVFIFCGLGPQFNQTGKHLYDNEPIFKQSMDKIDQIFSKHFGYSILLKLREIQDDDKITINEFSISQPTIFMVQISLFELYKQWGIIPSINVGHSFGEISSAYCSGLIDLETACFIIYKRAIIQSKTIGSGRMLVVNISEKEFNEKYLSLYPFVEISCFNSPNSIVINESEEILNNLSNLLKEKEIFTIMLGALSALHSSKQSIIKDEILSEIKDINFNSNPLITNFSTVYSNQFKSGSLEFNCNYIYDNIRKPVQFEKTISNIFKHIETNDLGSSVIFLELSPHPTLLHYIKEMIPINSNYFHDSDKSISVLSSLNKKKSNDDVSEIQKTISKLYCAGYNVDFKCQLSLYNSISNDTNFREVSYLIPRYQWDESVYFSQSNASTLYRKQGPTSDQLGYRNDSPFISYTSYIDIGEEPYQFLKGHQSTNRRVVFPGCGYLMNIIKSFPDQDLTIINLEFKSPFILREGIKQCLTTNIYLSGRNEYRAVFHYKDLTSGKWVQSCFGRFSTTKLNSDLVNEIIDFQSLKDTCNWTTMKRKEIYEKIKEMSNLTLTNSFQCIEEAHYGSDRSLCKISLDSISSYDNKSFFNIPILDGVFQVLSVLKNQPSTMMFDKIQNFSLFSENVPKSSDDRETFKNIYCYTEYINKHGDSYYANVIGFLPNGKILFHSPTITYSSLTPVVHNFTIEPPNQNLYSTCLQPIDSKLSSILKFNELFNFQSGVILEDLNSHSHSLLISSLFNLIKQENQIITTEKIENESIELLISNINQGADKINIRKKNLYELIFKILKQNIKSIHMNNYENNSNSILSNEQNQILKVISEILLKDGYDVTNNVLVPKFLEFKQTQLINEIVKGSIKSILNEKIVFRILELNNCFGEIIESIMECVLSLLNDNPLSEIDIEFTFSDQDDTYAHLIKDELSSILVDYKGKIKPKTSLLFKKFDINNYSSISEQLIVPSYYDIIILPNISNIKDIKKSIELIYQILSPNGYLIIIDTLFKSQLNNNKDFELIQKWLSFNYDNSNLNLNWDELLKSNDNNELLLKSTTTTTTTTTICSLVPQVILFQKLKFNYLKTPSIEMIKMYDQVIIYGDEMDNIDENELTLEELELEDEGIPIKRIIEFHEFENYVTNSPLTNKSLIVFISSINDLVIDNFQSITLDYIKINQYLLSNEIQGCKHVLITRGVQLESNNVCAASITGSFRYFCEFNKLNLYSFDFSDEIFDKSTELISIIHELTNQNKRIQREFIIRGSNIYYERLTLETNIKLKYKSNSYVGEKDQLVARLNSNLQYKFESRKSIKHDHIQVKTLATGINYKDSLVYRGLIPRELINHTGDYINPEFGFEMSGVVIGVGDKVTKFKIGDRVMATNFCSTSSHINAHQERFVKIPPNLSFVQAASIPVCFITSYYSLFIAGYLNIEKKESVLIHSASGGIGISCLELLKAKGFNGLLFLTVGSKDKEQFLLDRYGDMITGIYSSKNFDFVIEIKKKIKQITGSSLIFNEFGICKYGIDLIINSLPSMEFMDANFNSLKQGGRIIDLSVTHLSTTDTIDFNKFKYFSGYSTIELLYNGHYKVGNILQIIADMFENGQLSLLPIKEYQITQIKDAIEYINERKHIGKIVVNHESISDLIQDTNEKTDNEFERDYLVVKPDYKIDKSSLGKTVLISGQQGLSSTIIKFILVNNSNIQDKRVNDIIVFSKSPIKHDLEILIGFSKYENFNVNIHHRQVDISNLIELQNAINQIYKEIPSLSPIESIFHNAFIPSQCEPSEIDIIHLNESHSAKTIGALNLHTISIEMKLKLRNFVLASSFTTLMGSHRQCGYVSANCVLNSLSRFRNSIELPCTSMNWGVIGDSGYTARNESVIKLFEQQGVLAIPSNLILGSLDLLLENQHSSNSNKIITSFNFQCANKSMKDNLLIYKLDFFLNPIESKNSMLDGNEISIRDEIIDKFSEFLSTDPQKINCDIKLLDYGADSLMIVSLKNWLDQTYLPNMLSIVQLQNVTINQLIQTVTTKVSESNKIKKSPIKTKQKTKVVSNERSGSLDNQKDINWIKELELDISIKPTDGVISSFIENESINNGNAKTILLTGSSGFLGIYLLYYLLKSNQCKLVYCLSRNNTSKPVVLESLIQLLKYHKLFDDLSTYEIKKIEPVLGDYTMDLMGISRNEYILLSDQVDIIINSAANTSSTMDFSEAKSSIIGIDNCIKFSCNGNKLKKLVQISSMGVYTVDQSNIDEYYFQNDFNNDSNCKSFIKSQNQHFSPYFQCKVIADYHVKEAAIRGIPSMIIRPPFIFSNPETGINKQYDIAQSFFQSCHLLKSYPKKSGIYLYMTPTTWLANNISYMVLSSSTNNNNSFWNQPTPIKNLQCFNLFGESIDFIKFCKSLSLSTNLNWKEVSPTQFYKNLQTIQHESTKVIYLISKKVNFLKFITVPSEYKTNENLKQLLQLNNSYDGSLVTTQSVINHLNFVFKKK